MENTDYPGLTAQEEDNLVRSKKKSKRQKADESGEQDLTIRSISRTRSCLTQTIEGKPLFEIP